MKNKVLNTTILLVENALLQLESKRNLWDKHSFLADLFRDHARTFRKIVNKLVKRYLILLYHVFIFTWKVEIEKKLFIIRMIILSMFQNLITFIQVIYQDWINWNNES